MTATFGTSKGAPDLTRRWQGCQRRKETEQTKQLTKATTDIMNSRTNLHLHNATRNLRGGVNARLQHGYQPSPAPVCSSLAMQCISKGWFKSTR
jgi:hypothetical protein